MKRLGLVGVGAWGRRLSQTIDRRTDCEIVSYARASGGPSELLPRAKHVASWRALLERAVDGIVVATTPDNQAEVTLAAATAGIPVLVEKPLGATHASAARVLAAMRAAERPAPVLVDFVHLYAPAWLRLTEIASASASKIAAIDAAGHNAGPYRDSSALHDYASHDAAMCLALVGRDATLDVRDVRRVSASGSPGLLYEIRFDLGRIPVRLRSGNGAETKARRFAVRLEDGRELVYDDVLPHPGKLTDGGVAVPVDRTPPLDVVLDRFIARCEAWRAGSVSTESAVASVELAVRVAEVLDAFAAAAHD